MGDEKRILDKGLALSGGGYRAALFNLGTLWRLNELGYLKQLDIITSVSGGSITSGVLASRWKQLAFHDEVATNFEELVVQPICKFCKLTIDVNSVLGGIISPFYSISNKVAKKYKKELFHDISLKDLPKTSSDGPQFVFYATSLQTGSSVRMSATRLADYKVGQILDPDIPLSQVVAASSAFPPVLSPFKLKLDPNVWLSFKGAYLFANEQYRSQLILSDGGVYDNMGLEAIWDRCNTVLVSDAGAPLDLTPKPSGLWTGQIMRVLNIVTEQTRALRKRKLIADFVAGNRGGAYWGIGTEIANYRQEPCLANDNDLTASLAHIRTRLNTFSDAEQGHLINWGYALADAGMRAYVTPGVPVGKLPCPNYPLI